MINEEHHTYVAGIEVPSRLMIANFVNHSVKAKIIKPNFSYGDLVSWIEENDTVPFDDHDAFALDRHVEVNEKTPSASIIRLSTKNLISLAT